ncbi:MAG: ABC-2 family transporter protein, partial [Bacillota bacterium]
SVYPVSLRFLLTWVIPVGFIVTVPAEVLTGARGVTRVGGGLALAMVLLYVATRVFRAGLSRYSSASS